MRRPVIAGNWKMYKTAAEAAAFAGAFMPMIKEVDDAEIVICPTFTGLAALQAALGGSGVKLGGQNLHWEPEGAYTGEVSAGMLVDAGCCYVIIGHSERRQYFGETDDTVNRKLKSALRAGLVPIVCVGETLEERESGTTEAVCERQVRQGLTGLKPAEIAGLVIAYEPVWAIGTGRTATAADAQTVISFIRRVVADAAGNETAGTVRIQYGGSVKPENIDELMAQADIDGVLVGGASLKADSFAAIVNYKRC